MDSAVSMATCSAEAWIVSTARIGSAVRVIRLPRALIDCAPHKFRKSPCRQSAPESQVNHDRAGISCSFMNRTGPGATPTSSYERTSPPLSMIAAGEACTPE